MVQYTDELFGAVRWRKLYYDNSVVRADIYKDLSNIEYPTIKKQRHKIWKIKNYYIYN